MVWYQVGDLDAARDFYCDKLGFTEAERDADGAWVRLAHGETTIELHLGAPTNDGVANVVVDDVKGEAERLRREEVEVGIVLELAGQVRLLDVFDPDGNRIQLTEDLE